MQRYHPICSLFQSGFSPWTIVAIVLLFTANVRSEEILHGAYWENTEETVSEIGLHNNKAWKIIARVKLFSPEGRVLVEKNLVLPATSMQVIELKSILPTLFAGGFMGGPRSPMKGKQKTSSAK